LLLTTNKRVTRLLFQGAVPHKRTYVVMVRHIVTAENVERLRTGVAIKVQEGALYTTPPCDVELIEKPIDMHPDVYPYRELGPHSWLRITLTEGKYHQVRKMVAAIGNQCKRLVRVSIEDITLGSLAAGEVQELAEEDFFRLLKIDDWR
jgi:23S rRNA pseudouridine2457 synthase